MDNSQNNKKYRIIMHPLNFIEYHMDPETALKTLLQAINICKNKYNEMNSQTPQK